MDNLSMPPQVHLVQDGQIAEITRPVGQMGFPEMPLHSIIVGVCLGALEACECLLCIRDMFPASGAFILPRRGRRRVRFYLSSWRRGNYIVIVGRCRALPSSPKGPTLLKAAV